jgi:hypothetical protein
MLSVSLLASVPIEAAHASSVRIVHPLDKARKGRGNILPKTAHCVYFSDPFDSLDHEGATEKLF